jgi:hypothetical protein
MGLTLVRATMAIRAIVIAGYHLGGSKKAAQIALSMKRRALRFRPAKIRAIDKKGPIRPDWLNSPVADERSTPAATRQSGDGRFLLNDLI